MSNPALNGRHLQILVAVLHSRNLAEAALKLGISEPGISKALRLIEREAGVPLFARAHGRLLPTDAARRLLPQAERATRQLDAAVQFAYALKNEKHRPVLIAAHAPPLVAIVPPAVQRFNALRPDVTVEVRVESPLDVLRCVAHHEVDIGVTNPPAPDMDSNVDYCERRTISEDLLVAIFPARHPLVSRQVVRPDDLRDERLIAMPADSPTSMLVNAALKEAGVSLRAPVVASTSVGVCTMVQQGVGIGLINPLLLSHGMFPGIAVRPFRPRIVLWTEIYSSSLRPLSADAALMVRCIEEAAAEQRGHAPLSRNAARLPSPR